MVYGVRTCSLGQIFRKVQEQVVDGCHFFVSNTVDDKIEPRDERCIGLKVVLAKSINFSFSPKEK